MPRTNIAARPNFATGGRPLTGLSFVLTQTKRYLKAYLHQQSTPRHCPCCGYEGRFLANGMPLRMDSQCPKCLSLERHRLLRLALDSWDFVPRGARTLHFAAELSVWNILNDAGADIVTADIVPGRGDIALNIEAIDQPDESFDLVVASHVLEHVDDRKALPEIRRILRPGGKLLLLVPIIEGWAQTYEDPTITDPRDRDLHFGQDDHVRYYGADLRDRLTQAGFDTREFTATGADSVRFGLLRGEKIFLSSKSKEQDAQ